MTPSSMWLITSLFNRNGRLEEAYMCKILTQLSSCKSSVDIPRSTTSTGLLLVATRLRSSTLVSSRKSQMRIATMIDCFPLELMHSRNVLLSVYMNTWLAITINAQIISLLNRSSIIASCHFSFNSQHFVGATRPFANTGAGSFITPLGVMTRTSGNATTIELSCKLSLIKNISWVSKASLKKNLMEFGMPYVF